MGHRGRHLDVKHHHSGLKLLWQTVCNAKNIVLSWFSNHISVRYNTNSILHYLFIVFLDFKTILGLYVIAGLHILPVWFYALQKLEIVYKHLGSQAVAIITTVLVSGRLTCCLVEVFKSYKSIFITKVNNLNGKIKRETVIFLNQDISNFRLGLCGFILKPF